MRLYRPVYNNSRKVKMQWVKQYTVTQSSNDALQSIYLTFNNLWDIQGDASNEQPLGFNWMKAMYNKYFVHTARFTVTYSANPSTTEQRQFFMVLAPTDTVGTSRFSSFSSDFNDIIAVPGAKTRRYTYDGSATHTTMSFKWWPTKYFKKWQRLYLQGGTGGNPTTYEALQIGYWTNGTGATNTLTVTVNATYNVEWFDPNWANWKVTPTV